MPGVWPTARTTWVGKDTEKVASYFCTRNRRTTSNEMRRIFLPHVRTSSYPTARLLSRWIIRTFWKRRQRLPCSKCLWDNSCKFDLIEFMHLFWQYLEPYSSGYQLYLMCATLFSKLQYTNWNYSHNRKGNPKYPAWTSVSYFMMRIQPLIWNKNSTSSHLLWYSNQNIVCRWISLPDFLLSQK